MHPSIEVMIDPKKNRMKIVHVFEATLEVLQVKECTDLKCNPGQEAFEIRFRTPTLTQTITSGNSTILPE
jgi:hypothetical protein